jgi:protein tyrosine kinase modulator
MPTPPTAYDDSAKGPGLAGLLEIARRRRVLAVLPFLFVLTAAASLAVFLPSVWTAKTLVLTLSQDILTPARLMKIAQDYGLYQNMRRTQPADEVVERMRRDIHLELVEDKDRDRRGREQRSALFSIAYRAPDPMVAASVTNTLASLYIQENGRLREKQAAGTSAFLDTQLSDLSNKLKTQEQRITEYKEKYPGELPEQRDTNIRTMERLQQQLQLAHENNRRANERRQLLTNSLGELDMTSGMVAGPAGTGPNVTPADTAAARLNLLRQELAVMQTRFHDRYPDVLQMKDQIRILEAKVETEKKQQAAATAQAAAGTKKPARDLRVVPQNAYIQSLMTQLDQAQVDAKTSAEEMAVINRQIAVYQRRLENTPKREQELALITRDYETTRELHRNLLSKRGEAEMAAELEQRQQGETFRVIDPARLPDRPTGPNRFRLLLVGFALALGASGVAVMLAEQVDTSFRRVDEVRSTVPMPVLSAIPRITTEHDRTRRLRQRRWATAALAVGLFVVAGTSFLLAHNNQSLVALLSPAPPTAAVGR